MLVYLIKLIVFTVSLSISCTMVWSEVNPKLKRAQEILNEMGYKAGPTDGLWGNKTDTALQQFYKLNNSVFDGIFDDSELRFLIKIKENFLSLALKSKNKKIIQKEDMNVKGRWRGLAICNWDKDGWGGGEYKFGNGKFSGAIDFTIIEDEDDPTKRIFKKSNWLDYGGASRSIKSFEISTNKISFSDIFTNDQGESRMNWEGNLTSNNTLQINNKGSDCKAKLYRTEKISFESSSPKNLLDYVDGVKNDQKYTITGLLTFPEGDKEKYPLMMMIVNSGCGYNFRQFTYGVDIKNQGVATLELDNCKPRGLSESYPIGACNGNILNPWMGAADALYALKFLQTHPKVDIDKVGITGFSWGGQVALWTGIDLIRKSIVGDILDFALRVPYYPFCRQFDDPKYSKNKLHIFIGEFDAAPPRHCREMASSFNKLGYDVSVDVYLDAYHNFDDPFWDSPPPEFNPRAWFVTEKCNFWIDSDHHRSWRLGDMRIELDNYLNWDVTENPFYWEYAIECVRSGVKYGRNDSAAQKSAIKLVELINQHLK